MVLKSFHFYFIFFCFILYFLYSQYRIFIAESFIPEMLVYSGLCDKMKEE